jgi:hypothetical protein
MHLYEKACAEYITINNYTIMQFKSEELPVQ